MLLLHIIRNANRKKTEEPGNKAAQKSNESGYRKVYRFYSPEEVHQCDDHQNGCRDPKQPLKYEVSVYGIDKPCPV